MTLPAPPATGPCDWTPTSACTDCAPLAGLDPDLQDLVFSMAVNHIWKRTGSRFGLCPSTVTVCTTCISGCIGYCTCRAAVDLPWPAASLTSISVNGTEITDPDLIYVIEDYHLLIDTSTTGCCQPRAEWTVTYDRGLPIPPGGELVASILACEIAKAICNDTSCRLPRRMQALSRQGISITFLDDFSKGLTGIWEVDGWISDNSPATMPVSRVLSPDLIPARTQTWPTMPVA